MIAREKDDYPHAEGGLSVTVVLGEAITDMREAFMCEYNIDGQKWHALGRVDLRQTSLQMIGTGFLFGSECLRTVALPPSLTEVGGAFLGSCRSLHSVDMGHTALHTVGQYFAWGTFFLSLYLPG